MNSEMMEALYTIEREKGISVEIMLEALANALVTAYKRMPNAAEEALVEAERAGQHVPTIKKGSTVRVRTLGYSSPTRTVTITATG